MTARERKQRRRTQARTLRSEGRSIRAIASQLGVSVGTVHADLKPAPTSSSPLAQAKSDNVEGESDDASLSSRTGEAEHVEGEAEAGGREVETAAQEVERAAQTGAQEVDGARRTLREALPVIANARVRGGPYTEEEVERGLHALALCSGNASRAARALSEQGLPIGRETLEDWKLKRHPDRYQEIVQHELPRRYGRIAERSEDLAEQLAEAEGEVLAKLRAELPELQPRDIAGALRNLTVSRGISLDKASVIRGRPTEIREDRSLADLLTAIDANPAFRGVVQVDPALIESTAEEIADDE